MTPRIKKGLTLVIAAAFALTGMKLLGGIAGLGMVFAGDAYFESLSKLPGMEQAPAIVEMQFALTALYKEWSTYTIAMALGMLPVAACLGSAAILLLMKRPAGRLMALIGFALAFFLDGGALIPAYRFQTEMAAVRHKYITRYIEEMPPGPVDEVSKGFMRMAENPSSPVTSLALQSVVLFVYAGAFYFLVRREVKVALEQQAAAHAATKSA